ncbi:MAG: glycosyltransferase, partial [Ferruginibacter sp.]
NFLNRSHLLVFLSRMEGWPKVVAESMWWGCVPVTTAVSCVPWMLADGKRGVIVDRNPSAAADAIVSLLNDPEKYAAIQSSAVAWAREYTLDRFENEIKKLV